LQKSVCSGFHYAGVDLNSNVKLTTGEVGEIALSGEWLSVPLGDVEQVPKKISAAASAEEFVVLRPKLIFFPRLPGSNSPA